ncbi:MAG: F0F1 ATP synthase subunit gamma [Polyangiaceae bacterium]|nr:F0F1 ATP synthase subunit gamma [Polyangiaceae bacterium]
MTSEASLDLAAIERRMGAVRSVRQVLQSVWGLARAELPVVEDAAQAALVYATWAEEAARRVFVEESSTATTPLRVLIGPERAFAGSLPRRYEQELAAEGALGIVGRRLWEAVVDRPDVERRVRFHLSGISSPRETESCAAGVAAAILEHAPREGALLLHAGAKADLAQSTLLTERRRARDELPDMLSPLETISDALLRELLTARLANALAITLRAEVRARLTMVEAARTACDRRLEELTKVWRAARQDQITAEMMEIVAARLAFDA